MKQPQEGRGVTRTPVQKTQTWTSCMFSSCLSYQAFGQGGTNTTSRGQGMNEEGAALALADSSSSWAGPGAAVQWPGACYY